MKQRPGVHLSYAANLSKVWGPPLSDHTGIPDGPALVKDPMETAVGRGAHQHLYLGIKEKA